MTNRTHVSNLVCVFAECRNARSLQSSLAALADRIDAVRTEHDRLETENKFLQDYIGGLTRTMSRSGGVVGKGRK